jgi:hypothetical protein
MVLASYFLNIIYRIIYTILLSLNKLVFKQMIKPAINYARICFYSDKSFVVLKQKVEVFAQASHSIVLSLASFLLWTEPNLSPPGTQFSLAKTSFSHKKEHNYILDSLSNNLLYEPWCDYLANLLLRSHICFKN